MVNESSMQELGCIAMLDCRALSPLHVKAIEIYWLFMVDAYGVSVTEWLRSII